MSARETTRPIELRHRPKLKVGAVSYLNTKPLVYGLPAQDDDFDLVFDLPSRLADRLARSELDVALIPSVEFFQNPDYTIISDACIGCRGPVFSVKLFSRVPISQIKTLALDEGSRTSVALIQILLRERHNVAPQLQPLSIGAAWEDCPADAMLVIGDRAMHPPVSQFAEVWDLGDVWCRWAELPFVFAMWVARPGIGDTTALAARLSQARDRGVAHLTDIAVAEASRYELSRDQCLRYLRDNLHFTLGPRELAGLRLFHQHAVSLDLAPAGVPVLECTNSNSTTVR
jgi:chorismate dehydratase